MHTNMPEFRNKQSLSSIVIALGTQRTPRDSMTVLFLSILILASLRPFCFLDEVAGFSQQTVFNQQWSFTRSCSSCCGMFSFVPERTGRITQSQRRMNVHCVQVGEGKKNIYERCSSKKGNKIRLKPILLSQLSAGYRLILKLNILTLELSLII